MRSRLSTLLLVLLISPVLTGAAACGSPPLAAAAVAHSTPGASGPVTNAPPEPRPPEEVDRGAQHRATRAVRTARNVYASTLGGEISPAVAGIPARVYVPNSVANTLAVIDPATFKVVSWIPVSAIPHHVTPGPDLQNLYVNNEGASSLTVIDPRTVRATGTIAVPYPYNLYFTPDRTKAVVVVERLHRIDFRDPHDWHLLGSVDVPWRGVDHLDFSADGTYLLASTEWSGRVVRINVETMKIDGVLEVGGLPIDVRLGPAGDVFLVTNQGRNGVSFVDGGAMTEVAFVATGRGAHGIQLSRDTRFAYITNRLENTISVVDIAARRVVDTWRASGGPDMTQLNPEGTQLWVSGRFDGSVSVIDTRTGALVAHIATGAGAHGLSYFPNAGLVSVGHNGVYR